MKKTPPHPLKHKPIYYFGNLLIAISIIGFTSIAYPLVKDELQYRFLPYQPEMNNQDFSISIPEIKLNSTIIANVNPWNRQEYSTALEKGAAHALGSALPNEEGSIFIFAHSSGNPWEQAYTNTLFYRLNKLSMNNHITLYYQGQRYHYSVIKKLIVTPDQVEYLIDQSKNQLILQTCYPTGTDWKRLLVFANPQTSM